MNEGEWLKMEGLQGNRMVSLQFAGGLTGNKLKVIALVAMFFDHYFAVFVPHETLLGVLSRTPGRIAAPIFCYFVAEGYHHTSNRKKYMLRLLAFAIVSHLPFNMTFGYTFFQATSILWGLALGLVALSVIDNKNTHPVLKAGALLICCLMAVPANWNYVTVLWVVVFGIYRGNVKRQIIGFTVVGLLFHLVPVAIRFGAEHWPYPHWYQIGILLAIPLLLKYNGKQGRKCKPLSQFFYWFYPGHLLLIHWLDRIGILAGK